MDGNQDRVKVYGADWGAATKRVRNQLEQMGIQYAYINVEEDPAASEWVKAQNRGLELKPTLDIDGEVLCNPRPHLLEGVLSQRGVIR